MEDINVLPRLKRRISSPEISHAKSPLAADPILSVYKLPAVKKQRSSLSSPILPKENYEVRSSKSRGMIASSCPSHVRPWKDLSHAIHTYSCDWSDDPHEIDARATSYYLGMHRNICSDPLRASTVAHNVRAAIDHAWQFLQLVHLIDKSSLKRSEHDSTKRTQKRPLESGWSTPFIGYAILTAVDAISAGGSVETYEEMMTVMHQSLVVVDRLSQLWASAGGQSRLIRQRIAALEECVESKHSMDKSAWKCTHALDPSLGQGHDVFYNSHDVKGMKLFEYLGIKVREDEVLLVVGKMDYSEMPKGDMSQQYS